MGNSEKGNYQLKFYVMRPETNDLIEIDPSQAWFWKEKWQAAEREVDQQIKNEEYEQLALLEVTEQLAEVILKMEEVCYTEGVGPDSRPLLEFIRKHFPLLASKYDYLYSGLNLNG